MARQPSAKKMHARYKRFTREIQADAIKGAQSMSEYKLLDETDTFLAVFNLCGDSPQTRATARTLWAQVQARMIELRPQSNFARNVQAEAESAYNLVKSESA